MSMFRKERVFAHAVLLLASRIEAVIAIAAEVANAANAPKEAQSAPSSMLAGR